VIQVQNCTVTTATPTEADGRQFCFKITPVSRKIYLINASDEVTRDAWIDAVRNNSTCAYDAASHSADGSSSGETKMEEEPNSEDVHNVAGTEKEVTVASTAVVRPRERRLVGPTAQCRSKLRMLPNNFMVQTHQTSTGTAHPRVLGCTLPTHLDADAACGRAAHVLLRPQPSRRASPDKLSCLNPSFDGDLNLAHRGAARAHALGRHHQSQHLSAA